MMAKRPRPQSLAIGEAALRIVASEGWNGVTVERVAKAAKVKTDIANKYALLPLMVQAITAESLSGIEPDRSAPLHDLFFDALMARFDVLQKHRAAILALVVAAKRDSKVSLILVPAQIEAMKKTLRVLGVDSKKSPGNFAGFALYAIFISSFRVWRRDETLDMSKTMAALDRVLRYAGRAATLLRIELAR